VRRRRHKTVKKTASWLKRNWKGFLALGIVTGVRNFFFTKGVGWAVTAYGTRGTELDGIALMPEEAKKLD
jgi:hypothetical protein